MLTPERLEALIAVRDGKIGARHIAAQGSPLMWEPQDKTVALGFLRKAELIDTETTQRHSRFRAVRVFLTERGEHALAGIQT